MFGDQSIEITKSVIYVWFWLLFLYKVYPTLGNIFKKTVVIHIDTDVNNIAKNHHVDISYVNYNFNS